MKPILNWKSISFIPRPLQNLGRKESLTLNLLAFLIGIGSGLAAIGFRALIGVIQNAVLYDKWDYHLISPLDHNRGYWILLILPVGLLISTLITHLFAREAKGHGVPEVIEAVWFKKGIMRKRVFLLKALASGVTIATGGSVGREGPIVQIGSGLASVLGQSKIILSTLGTSIGQEKLLKILIGCGAAGAIAATFNTPIAGVIFAIEIIVLELRTKSFVPLVISSVVATALSRFYIGNEPAFVVPEHVLTGPHELGFYLVLGLISGLIGVLFIRTLYGFEDFFDHLRIPFWTKPLIAGFILAAITIPFPEMLGVGYEFVSQTLQENASFALMTAFIFLKIFSTSLTLAGGGSGGVFAPSLFIGAMVGGSYGYWVHQFFPGSTESYDAYALVGMAAMFSATGRATFTAIVILFEMTLDYSIILPLMLTCVIADQVSLLMFKDSVYSLKLKRKGLKFINDISVDIMSITPVKDIMTRNLDVIYDDMTLEEALEKAKDRGHDLFPVVDHNRYLRGIVFKKDLHKGIFQNPEDPLQEIIQPAKAVAFEHDSVESALKKIENIRDPRILVLSAKTSKLVGIVSPINFVKLKSKEQ